MVYLTRICLLLMSVVSLSAQFSSDLGKLGGGASNPFGTGMSSPSASPFGTRYDDSAVIERSKLFDLSKVSNATDILETREKFDIIWSEFRRMHAVDVRGCFSPQADAAAPDDAFTLNALLHYVHLHSPKVVLFETEKCKKCGPDGTVPKVVKDLVVINIPCPNCGGAKMQKFKTEYRLVWTLKLPPKTALPDELRAAIGFKGELSSPAATMLRQLERSRFAAKPSTGFGVSDVSVGMYNGRLDLILTLAGKPDLAAQNVGYTVTFHSDEEGRGQVLATASGQASSSGAIRLTFAQLEYPGVSADSFRLTADYYAEALGRLSRAKSVIVTLSDLPATVAKLSGVEKQPKSFAVQIPPDPGFYPVASGSAPKPKRTFYGSGMVFTSEGHVFTNQHVIEEGKDISIVVISNGQLIKRYPATIVSKDAKIDLAILKINGWAPPEGSQATPPQVVSSVQCKLGKAVFVMGFPLPSTLSSNVKYTNGVISDTSGIGDDSTKIQHTASIQPGNSGGPMALDDGRIIGVVVSSLSPSFMLKKTGSIPQGVNFSIKTDYLLTMAKVAGIDLPEYPASLSPVDHVKSYTVQIMCED